MPIWEQFPYSNTHELNLDWIISKVKDLDKFVSEIVGQNIAGTIIFANPIQWDINNDYGKYNLVLDSNYSAYLSIKDVPAGTLLSDTVYWEPVGNFALILELALSNFAYNQGNDPIAAQTYAVGDLLVYNEVLYQVTSVINMGYTIDPGNNCTQVTVDDLYKTLKASVSNNTSAISSINNSITTINNTLAGLKPQIRIKNHFRYYIDGINGSDDNTGLSSTEAFKTIDKFLSLSDQYTEIRGFIISAGTYSITLGYQMAGVSVHLTAQTSGVILEFPVDTSNDFSIYACHMNLQGQNGSPLTIKTTTPGGRIYSDNVAWTLKYVNIPYDTLSIYGGNLLTDTCQFRRVFGVTCQARFTKTDIVNTDIDVIPWEFECSQVYITGSTTSADLSSAGTVPYFKGSQSYVNIASVIVSNTTNKYTEGLYLAGCYLNISTTRLNSMASRSQNGNVVDSATHGNNVFTY